jgi:hypothetical protein
MGWQKQFLLADTTLKQAFFKGRHFSNQATKQALQIPLSTATIKNTR